MEISDRIKELRINKNMTQEELGNKVGVKKAAINKYENGSVQNLKRSMIQKLSDALDVTPSYLMGWEEKEPANNDELQEITDLLNSLPDDKRKQAIDYLRFLKG